MSKYIRKVRKNRELHKVLQSLLDRLVDIVSRDQYLEVLSLMNKPATRDAYDRVESILGSIISEHVVHQRNPYKNFTEDEWSIRDSVAARAVHVYSDWHKYSLQFDENLDDWLYTSSKPFTEK